MQRVRPRRQALDGGDLGAVRLDGQHEAGTDRRAVEEDGAGAAHAVLAPDVGAGESEPAAQEVRKQQARRHLRGVLATVDPHADLEQDAHARLARSPARVSARTVSTPARSRRYAAVAWMSV